MGGALSTSSISTISYKETTSLPITVKPTTSLSSTQLTSPTYDTYSTGGVTGFSATDQLADLRGKTLELRPLTPADYESYKALRERNIDRLAPVAASRELLLAGTESPEAFEAIWQLGEQARAMGTDFGFGVFEGDDLIGEVGLEAVRRGVYESAFLSAYIDEARAGNNKVEEAFVLLCKFAFTDLGLNRIECAVLDDNQAVRRALEKVGVTSEGVARDYLLAGGEFRDHHRYVITAADWTERGQQLLSEWAGI